MTLRSRSNGKELAEVGGGDRSLDKRRQVGVNVPSSLGIVDRLERVLPFLLLRSRGAQAFSLAHLAQESYFSSAKEKGFHMLFQIPSALCNRKTGQLVCPS